MCLLLGLLTTVGLAWASAVLTTSHFARLESAAVESEGSAATGVLRTYKSAATTVTQVEVLDGRDFVINRQTTGRDSRYIIGMPRGTLYLRSTEELWSLTPYPWKRVAREMCLESVSRRAARSGIVVVEHGWPWRCLTSLGKSTNETVTLQSGGLRFPWAQPRANTRVGFWTFPGWLAAVPLAPGLIADTLFFAAAFFAAHQSIASIQRRSRYRRGLCPACRYDLEADYSNGCPECGWGRRDQA